MTARSFFGWASGAAVGASVVLFTQYPTPYRDIIRETVGWALPNLVLPLVTIWVALAIQHLRRAPLDWQEVIKDGQVCFYAVGILAPSIYDLRHLPKVSATLEVAMWAVLFFATILYALLATDHQAKNPEFDKFRAAEYSVAVGSAAVGLVCYVRWLILTT